ncbi:MAG: tetratricopeptide repeat protein [Candidatus Altiarchaeota archaeon]|nr:tetratricopeptide repeat protein [Candidatus Altiarchaeota archaeon]
MKKTVFILALIILAGVCVGMPSEEECYGEIEGALGNIEDGQKSLAGDYYLLAGSCYKQRGEYNKAVECFLKAAKLRDEMGAISGVAYLNAGDVYREMGDEGKAMECYHLAIDSYVKAGRLDESLARIYLRLGDYDNACKYCELDEDFSREDCRKYGFCKGDTPSINLPGNVGSISIFFAAVLIIAGILLFMIRKMG